MHRWLIAVVLAAASPAHADGPSRVMAPPPEPELPALDAMKDYFRGEVYGGFTLIGMGLVGLGAGTTMVVTADGRDGVRGAGYTLLGFGAAHTLAGIFVGASSVSRIKKFGRDIDGDVAAWTFKEEKRMRGVSKQFLVLKIVEGVGIAGGIGLAAYGRETDRPGLTGVGIAVAGELAATLVFDIIAARRAKRYRTALGGIVF